MTRSAWRAPYHAMTNGGHITYVEVDGDPSRNIDAFEDIIRAMKEMGVGYGSINHPVDRDLSVDIRVSSTMSAPAADGARAKAYRWKSGNASRAMPGITVRRTNGPLPLTLPRTSPFNVSEQERGHHVRRTHSGQKQHCA